MFEPKNLYAIQHGNAASLIGTLPFDIDADEFFYAL